ncbi:MAG: response regulator [SAR324 cluster bacterium]|nr:response regulator [SAR324 cluster bacterium]MBF0350018.1 response regulator [SAR324 cluster bacterium]
MEYTKILIVDDDQDMTMILGEILKQLGHDVSTAHNAEEAMTLIKTEEFFIVIADIHMPVISGIELLKWIKEFNSMIQVFIMTAHSNKATIVECLSSGATDYFEKPFRAEDIVLSMHAAIYRIQKWAKILMRPE